MDEPTPSTTSRRPQHPARIGTGVLDARVPLDGFDFGGAERWHVLVLDDGVPVARVELPSPGATAGTALAEAVFLRHADRRQAEAALIEDVRGRLGASAPRTDPRRPVSVVVCTHRRPEHLPALLASLAELEPAPSEVIVVDNAPGEEDCRDAALAAGFRYVREDRKGLDNARNAGARAARGEIVAFTDDDVVLPPTWLAPLDELFAHEGVAVVTGPAFPYLLDTPSQIRMERQASLARGLRRVVYDFQEVSPLHASGLGVGANMAIRREHLAALGDEPFPPELDAGTRSESGGDMYVFAKLLLAGHRIVYEPRSFVFHQHRSDPASLRKAVFGYGVGLTAALSKFVVEEGELTAGWVWLWLVRQYLKTQRRRIIGRADAVETLISWEYLRGGLHGARRWRQALEVERVVAATIPASSVGRVPIASPAPEPEPAAGPPPVGAAGDPRLTVIVPTFKRPEGLRRCLAALAAQHAPAGTFEVLVIDDDPGSGTAGALAAERERSFALRVEPNPGRGPAAARNFGATIARGEVLLFLDDDIVAGPSLIRRHLDWHAVNARGVLIGAALPRPAVETLVAAAARLWWQDFFRLLSGSLAPTFFAALIGNTSIPRALWAEVGGLDTGLARARREDWEWGLRLLAAGTAIGFDPEAWADHEYVLRTAGRLQAARREGIGDALIAATHEGAAHALPLAKMRPVGATHPRRALGLWLWRQDAVRAVVVAYLDLLERTRMREPWMRLFRSAQKASYALGALEGGWRVEGLARVVPPTIMAELDSEAPIPAPRTIPPELRLRAEGEDVLWLRPLEGLWSRSFAEQIVAGVPEETTLRIAMARGWISAKPEAHRRADETEVILGPANQASDREGIAALEATGATVRVADGDAERHWRAVREKAAAGERPLIAIPLPGSRPSSEWLADALVGFDGERVGLAYGGVVAPGVPPEPLYLHDAGSADFALVLGDQVPAYLVLRRELLGVLDDGGPALAPALGAVGAALAAGQVVGHRNARGLATPAWGERERGEAFGYLEVTKADRASGAERRRALATGAVRAAAALIWSLARSRGRLNRDDRLRAGSIARGALRGLVAGHRQS